MKIGILTAMQVEFDQVAASLSNVKTEQSGTASYLIGSLAQHTIILSQCGIGKVNAASGATQLIMQYQPDCVINTGCAGGLDKSLRLMDVVVSSSVCHHDVWCGEGLDVGQVQGLPSQFPTDQVLVQKALSMDVDVNVVAGLICTGDRFITDHQELAVIKQNFPDALAVEMESAAIGQVCFAFNVPFVSFRVISDTPGVDAHIEQFLNFWDTMAHKNVAVIKAFLSSL